MPVIESSVPAALGERARHNPDGLAFSFIDYEVDPAGYAHTLTWSQLYQRVRVVARELASCGSPGDRAAILAPQGLEYIVGVLGAMQAGFIAVPLSPPMSGVHDERVDAVLKDSSPVAILTTSDVVADVDSCVQELPGSAPAVIEIDALDLDTPVSLPVIDVPPTRPALLQYTSGSTRAPTGVVVTHKNLIVNLNQIMADFFEHKQGIPPRDATLVSWLPFFHDMGLMFGIFIPIGYELHSVVTDPISFLQKPARWLQLLASYTQTVSPAPNFAFDLAVRRTSDEDMAGLDLGNVIAVISGAERVQAATVRRFTERFSQFNLPDTAVRAAYGLAEATVYVTTAAPQRQPTAVRFDYEKLSAGFAEPCEGKQAGSELISHGPPRACTVRIVDPETHIENPAGKVGEIWVHGDNVAGGYWRNPEQSERIFSGRLVDPSPGLPPGPWLRSGDLGVISEGELFIIGRIKDLLIVDGRNHYPDDIETKVQGITGGRVAAISAPSDPTERLVVIVELKQRGNSDEEIAERYRTVKQDIKTAISTSYGVRPADLVLVSPGSIPITTSGKVRRSSCAELYRQDQFARLDNTA